MRAAWAVLVAVLGLPPAGAQQVRSEILVHTALTAGLAHHEARAVWDDMRVGDDLALVREPGNAHDANAVRVEWRGRLLGYLPREDNQAVARQMDRGSRLSARVARLDRYRNNRLKLQIEVLLRL